MIAAGIITAVLLFLVSIVMERRENRRRAEYWNRIWITRKWGDKDEE